MALMSVAPGTRMLGGLSAPSTGIAEQFQAGVQANLGRQATRQAMQLAQSAETRAQSAEARAQATFEAQQEAQRRAQAAAAAAQAREAQRRALLQQYAAPPVGAAPNFFAGQQPPPPATPPRVNAPAYPIGEPVVESPGEGRTGAPRGRYRPDAAATPAGLTIPPYTLQPTAPTAGLTPPAYTTQRAAPVQGPPASAGARTYSDFVAAARAGQPLGEQELIRSVEAGMLTPQQAADAQAMLDGYVPSEQEVRVATAPGLSPMPDTGYVPPAGYQALENFILGVTGETLAEKRAREEEYAARAGEDYTQRVPVTTPEGRRTTVEVDEGPVLSFGGGLRTAESDSPIDFILGQPVGSGATAPIPRDLPRLNGAIQQGITERERLVEAYNAFSRAGFAEDANAYLTAIQNLDQTLIRLQGEQALNDLTLGYPERASMVLSHYLGADTQLVLNSEDMYDLYLNGQPVENEDLIDMSPQDAADLVRRYYDSGYQTSMDEVRNTYLTEKAKRQAEQDVADAAARQALESAGYEIKAKESIPELGDGWRSVDPRTGKEYFGYVVGVDEDGIPQTRVIEIPTGARLGG